MKGLLTTVEPQQALAPVDGLGALYSAKGLGLNNRVASLGCRRIDWVDSLHFGRGVALHTDFDCVKWVLEQ